MCFEVQNIVEDRSTIQRRDKMCNKRPTWLDQELCNELKQREDCSEEWKLGQVIKGKEKRNSCRSKTGRAMHKKRCYSQRTYRALRTHHEGNEEEKKDEGRNLFTAGFGRKLTDDTENS